MTGTAFSKGNLALLFHWSEWMYKCSMYDHPLARRESRMPGNVLWLYSILSDCDMHLNLAHKRFYRSVCTMSCWWQLRATIFFSFRRFFFCCQLFPLLKNNQCVAIRLLRCRLRVQVVFFSFYSLYSAIETDGEDEQGKKEYLFVRKATQVQTRWWLSGQVENANT